MENEILNLKLDDIIPNRFQPREIFDEEALEKLADSIKQHGVIEPIIVRPVANKFEIIAGERRYKASVLAGLTKIPAIVKQMDDKESSIVAYIENEHRAGVSAIEEARTIERILKSNNMTQEELAKELGINQSTIANKLRLLNLPMEVQDALMHNEISERHARSLLTVKEEEKQIELLNKIKEKKMTVRELEGEIKNMYSDNSITNMNNIEGVNNGGTNPANTNQFLNSNVSMETGNSEPIQTNGSNFMSFLKNYDNSNPLPGSPEAKKQFLTPAPSDSEFIKFVNDYEKNKLDRESSNEPASENSVSQASSQNDDFTSFLNDFDSKYQIPSDVVQGETVANENVNSVPETSVSTQNDDFTSFLNDFDSKYQIPSEIAKEETVPTENKLPENNVQDSDFMSFLNDFDSKYQIPSEVAQVENVNTQPETSTPSQNNDFMSFLNDYDKNYIPPSQGPIIEPIEEDNNYQEPINNVQINDVNPPITSGYNPNQYVEDNPNYVDVSKNVFIDNVDDIIERIKNVIDDIKATSKLKIDTDEINFDDIYQVTIKIDKRNF